MSPSAFVAHSLSLRGIWKIIYIYRVPLKVSHACTNVYFLENRFTKLGIIMISADCSWNWHFGIKTHNKRQIILTYHM